MEDLTKHVVITGASSGIGRAAAVELARRGWRLTLVGRDQGRLEQTAATVREQAPSTTVRTLTADFAVLAQVRALADQLAGDRIDVLANNAGLMIGRRETTVDGHEATMQTNHLSPFLLSVLLRDQLAGGRIVNTASAAHSMGTPDPADLDGEQVRYNGWKAYGASKSANILFAEQAAVRWPELLSYSFHPGVVRTGFGTPLAQFFYRIAPGLRTPEQGADQLVWLSTADAAELVNGAYYVDRKVARPRPALRQDGLGERLWERSAGIVGV